MNKGFYHHMLVKADTVNKLNDKKVYIEYIRAFAAITVVLLHIVMTLPANYSVRELGELNSAIFNGVYMPTRWAVPCFVMVSGALLLDPKKNLPIEKIWKYIKRMLFVLLIFGTGFALMELVFSEKKVAITMLFKAMLNVAEGKSWSHLWYLYVLIALYIITIPLKYAVEKMSRKELNALLCTLIAGNFVIPFINAVVGTQIKELMILTEYATYYLLGYWLATSEWQPGKLIIVPAIIVTAIMITTDCWFIFNCGTVFELNHQSKDLLTLIQASSVFLFFKSCFVQKKEYGVTIRNICDCSFAIYIIHPFWINLLYKVFNFTPLSMPIWLGILVLFTIVFSLSFATAAVLKRVPFFKKIL